MDSLHEIKKSLREEAKKIKEEQDSDVVKRTVANSIKLEKSKLVGITAASRPQIDELINRSIPEFMEKNNAP
jgi:hypothetical protein